MRMIVLTDAELDLLMDEPAEVVKLYVSLRRRMDFSSGMVGTVSAVSWWALREDMSVAACRGRREHGAPTERMVEKKVDALEKLGLVERRTIYRRLAFFLPKAHRASARQKELGPTWGRQAGPDVGAIQTIDAQGFECGSGAGCGAGEILELGHTSGFRGNGFSVVNAAAEQRAVVDDASMPLPAEQIAVWLRAAEKRRGKIVRVSGHEPLLKSWSAEGVRADELEAAYALAVADREARNEAAPIMPGFLNVFVDRARATGGRSSSRPWFCTASGIEAKGRALGVAQQPEELFPVFRARVLAAAGVSDDEARRWQA